MVKINLSPGNLWSLHGKIHAPPGGSAICWWTFCACLGGVNSVTGMAEFGRDYQTWCAQWRALPQGISAHDTFDRVLQFRECQPLQDLCARWVEGLATLEQVTAKSPEITAIPALRHWRTVQGCIVTMDRVPTGGWDTQTEMAQTIRARQADHILAVNGNQPPPQAAI